MKRLAAIILTVGTLTWAFVQAAPPVTVVHYQDLPGPALHGLTVLESALGKAGVRVTRTSSIGQHGGALLVAGVASAGGPAARLLQRTEVALPEGAEGLLVKRVGHDGRPVLVVCGGPAGLECA